MPTIKYYDNIYTSNRILIQIYRKKSLSWDSLTTGFILNENGWNKIIDCISSLPLEAFDVGRKNCYQGMGQIYTCFNLNKKYLIENNNLDNLIDKIKNIFEDESNLNHYDSWKDELQDFDIFIKKMMGEISNKYEYWLKKKKENAGYNRYKILERDGFKCKLCGRSPPEAILHIDHWIPKAKGGLDIYENLVTLCSKCNQSKSATIPKYKIEEVLDDKRKL